MISDVHAHFDLLTPKELRGHTFTVGRVGITDEHGHPKKIFFEPKGYFWTFFQTIFFSMFRDQYGYLTTPFRSLIIMETFFIKCRAVYESAI